MRNFKFEGRVTFKDLGILFFFGLLVQLSSAQNTVSGVITDTNNIGIPGANIVEKGTSNGVVSDFDGNYAITVGDDAVLVVSYLGFITQEIPVNGRTSINVALSESLSQLDEVVVIGYGTQLKEELSGSVASVVMDDLENIPQVSVDQLIQGRAAGVTVTQNTGQPGGAVSVKIRGISSINGSNEPLYIIDGVPVSADATGRERDASSPLSGINPNDIASIDILKDASATAIYGSRGSNGVVIITTKKGSKTDGKIKFSTYTGLQQPTNILPVMNLREYAAQQNEMNQIFGLPETIQFRRPELLGDGTNWQKEIFENALMHNYQLSFSGGSDKSQYYMSIGRTDQDGTVQKTSFDRTSIRLNLDSQIKDFFKVGISLTASRTNEVLIPNSNTDGIIALALLNNPAIATRNPDGSFAGPTNAFEESVAVTNPLARLESIDNTLRRDRILGNIYADLKIFEGLTYRAEFGGTFTRSDNNNLQKAFSFGTISNDQTQLDIREEKNDFWIIKNLLNYNTTFDKHNISAMLGHEAQESTYKGTTASGTGFVDDSITTLNNSDAEFDTNSQYEGASSLVSYFGRLIYVFDNKYTLSASMRADGSSKFAEGNKWGYFPSFSAAWRLSNEPFMEGFDAIQDIKIFGGYGEVGNQAIPDFAYGSRLTPVATGLGTGFKFANFANPDLTWETQKQINLGVDFSLFKGNLKTTVEVYEKKYSDFLFQISRNDATVGGTGVGAILPNYSNIGESINRGIDVNVNMNLVNTENFSWTSNLNFQHYTNEVTELAGGLTLNGQASLDQTTQILTETREGQSIGVFYGYQVEGLFRTLDDLNNAPIQFGFEVGDESAATRTWLGDIKYKDVNNDGVIDGNDRTEIGSPIPDFTYGWQNNFKYKNFELGVFVQGSYGNEIFNAIGRSLTATNTTYRNQLNSVTDYWTPTNPDATHPRYTANATNNILISDRYIEDGSYLRIQNVRLGYNFDSSLLDKIGMSRLSLYGSIQNLYTFTNYSGYDPEVGSLYQSSILSGVDNGRYPVPRTYTLGLDIEF